MKIQFQYLRSAFLILFMGMLMAMPVTSWAGEWQSQEVHESELRPPGLGFDRGNENGRWEDHGPRDEQRHDRWRHGHEHRHHWQRPGYGCRQYYENYELATFRVSAGMYEIYPYGDLRSSIVAWFANNQYRNPYAGQRDVQYRVSNFQQWGNQFAVSITVIGNRLVCR